MFHVAASSAPIRNLCIQFTGRPNGAGMCCPERPASCRGEHQEGLGPSATCRSPVAWNGQVLFFPPRQDRTKEGGWQESQVRGCQGKSLEACPEDQQGGTCHLERGLLLPISYQPFKDPGRSAGATPVHRWVNPCPDCPRALPVDTRLGQGWGWGLLTHKPHPTPGSSP